jgi:hypothetical protein
MVRDTQKPWRFGFANKDDHEQAEFKRYQEQFMAEQQAKGLDEKLYDLARGAFEPGDVAKLKQLLDLGADPNGFKEVVRVHASAPNASLPPAIMRYPRAARAARRQYSPRRALRTVPHLAQYGNTALLSTSNATIMQLLLDAGADYTHKNKVRPPAAAAPRPLLAVAARSPTAHAPLMCDAAPCSITTPPSSWPATNNAWIW